MFDGRLGTSRDEDSGDEDSVVLFVIETEHPFVILEPKCYLVTL